MSNLKGLTPFQLGETNKKEAIEVLISYLQKGNDNDKRLAASAITKLAINFKEECYKALPALINNLHNPKPQVRQYTLKCLKNFKIPEQFKDKIISILRNDEKDYNKDLAAKILGIPEGYISDNLMITNVDNLTLNSDMEENEEGVGFVYFIKEDFSGRIKIGKTKNLNQRLKLFSVKLPFDIELLHYVKSKNIGYTENLFHDFFETKRVNGEWFELDVDDILWVLSGIYTEQINKTLIKNNTQPQYNQKEIFSLRTEKPSNSISEKQITFLSNLISEKNVTLNIPIDFLDKHEASLLISHFYKGLPITNDIEKLISFNDEEKKNIYKFES